MKYNKVVVKYEYVSWTDIQSHKDYINFISV